MIGTRVRIFLTTATVAALGAAAAAACSDGGGGGTGPGPQTGSIVGQVTAGGNNVPGATVVHGSATQTTGANGQVRFDNVAAGSQTVTLQTLPAGFSMGTETAAKTTSVQAGATANVSWSVQAAPQANVREIRVTGAFAFNPADVTVARGTTIRWINDSSVLHTVTSETGAWQEGELANQGNTFEVTLSTAGTYRYRCRPHSSNFTTGMVGVITVQ